MQPSQRLQRLQRPHESDAHTKARPTLPLWPRLNQNLVVYKTSSFNLGGANNLTRIQLSGYQLRAVVGCDDSPLHALL